MKGSVCWGWGSTAGRERECRRWMMLVWLLAACLGLPEASWAVEVTRGPEVEFSPVTASKGVVVTLRWQTDVECGTRLRYGAAPEKLDQKAGEGVAMQHQVTLHGLNAGQTYHYAVGTAKTMLKTGSFQVVAGGASLPETKSPTGNAPKADAATPVPPRAPPVAVVTRPAEAPPAKVTWGYLPSLQDHFDRHGRDFKSASKEDYARQAWEFLQQARQKGFPAKLDESDGTLRIYDPATGSFAAYNRNGTTKTFFKPGGSGYWDRQPGRPVRLRQP